jgi:hypothetical protein
VFSDSKSTTKSASISAPSSQLADLSTNWKVTFTSTGKTKTAIAAGPVFLEIEGGKPQPSAPDSPPEHPVLGPNGVPNPLLTRPGHGMRAYFDPPIREAALVTINGHAAGALWHPPYRLDISKLLKAGQNHIEIQVYNTALNAWSALPPHDHKPLIAKFGDRFQMQDLEQVKPLSSGLLGRVHLLTQGSK